MKMNDSVAIKYSIITYVYKSFWKSFAFDHWKAPFCMKTNFLSIFHLISSKTVTRSENQENEIIELHI